jgi:cytidylate kinase
MRGPVIAISGRPGSGKSSLAVALCREIGAGLIAYDDYEIMTRKGQVAMQDWLARGAPYAEIETPGLVQALQAAAGRGPVVFDTPLGRALPVTAGLIDHAIWIDCPAEIALTRKLAQLAEAVPETQAAAFVTWLRGYLQAQSAIVLPACEIQLQRVAPLADLRLDGAMSKLALQAKVFAHAAKLTR